MLLVHLTKRLNCPKSNIIMIVWTFLYRILLVLLWIILFLQTLLYWDSMSFQFVQFRFLIQSGITSRHALSKLLRPIFLIIMFLLIVLNVLQNLLLLFNIELNLLTKFIINFVPLY